MLSTSANNGAMSSPRAFAAPMALECALRSACNVSVFTCKSLRCSSNAVSFSVSRIKLRFTFNYFLEKVDLQIQINLQLFNM